MSEYINNSEKRVEDLLAFSLRVMNGENVKDLIDKYSEAINNITPHDQWFLDSGKNIHVIFFNQGHW